MVVGIQLLNVNVVCKGIEPRGSLSTPVLGPKPKPRTKDHLRGGNIIMGSQVSERPSQSGL